MRRFELALPNSVSDCLAALGDGDGDVKMVAGGTDLLPQMKNGLIKPARVVDLSGIAELKRLEVDGDGALHIGAAVDGARPSSCPRRCGTASWLSPRGPA